MRFIHIVCCLAVAATALPVLGCGQENKEAASAKAQLSQERAVAGVQDRARSLLLASQVQLHDLQTSRDQITDMHQRDAIASQIIDLSMARDQLMGDMAVGGPDVGPMQRDMGNLQRAMRGVGAAEAQPQSEPPPQQQQQQQRVEPPPR